MNGAELTERWDDVLTDTDTTAEAYRERGWTAVALHPGDVNAVVDEARLHVLLPGSEFDEANETVDPDTLDGVKVYGANEGSTRFRLVVAESESDEIALCVPTFVLGTDAEDLHTAAERAGGITIRLRPLDDRDHVEFGITDPDVFFDSVEK